MPSDYTLSFLDTLGDYSSDDDIERAWAGRTFPLLKTADFEMNWQAIPDQSGTFVMSNGYRYRVEPQGHFRSQCQTSSFTEDGLPTSIPYEAIIFSKVAYQLFQNQSEPEVPIALQRRRFLHQYVGKLPRRWREVIIQQDLHLYDDIKARKKAQVGNSIYRSLGRSDNIRLLSLFPATDQHAPIECTLREERLGACLEYEALSYVWGDPGKTKDIILNGARFSVTENLESALRHIRTRGPSVRILWIDAVCIDQSNDTERAQQVAQMDVIYRNATRVVVWLGRETNTSSSVFDGFSELTPAMKDLITEHEEFLTYPTEPEPYCPECDGYANPPTQLADAFLTPAAAHNHREAMNRVETLQYEWSQFKFDNIEAWVKILKRPWWQRVWVMQEMILAKEVIVMCGSRTVEWVLFHTWLYTLIRQGRRALTHQRGGLGRQARLNFELLHSANTTLMFFFLHEASPYAKRVKSFPLSSLLTLSWNFEATDPRDKIFALVGLLAADSLEKVTFSPDYRLATSGLYKMVAKFFIQQTRTLDILSARPHPPALSFRGLRWVGSVDGPSWVPDWTMPNIFLFNSIALTEFSLYSTLRLYLQDHTAPQSTEKSLVNGTAPIERSKVEITDNKLFNASLDKVSPFQFQFSYYDEVLQTRGLMVDSIVAVGQPFDLGKTVIENYQPGPQNPEHLEILNDNQKAIIHEWKNICHADTDAMYKPTGQPLLEAFWRTIFLDRYIVHMHDSHQVLQHQRSGHQILRLPSPMDEQQRSKIFKTSEPITFPPESPHDEDVMLWNLRFHVTEEWSYTGLNLHCVNLRFFVTSKNYIGVCHPDAKVGDKAVVLLGASVPYILRQCDEGYLFVGESYIHGIMDGEIIKAYRDQGGGTKEEDFDVFSII